MSTTKTKYVNEYLKDHTDFYFTYNNKDLLGSPSGLKSIDKNVEGFFGLVGLTGEPGTGKTSLAIQTAVFNAFVLNKPVLYVSLEVNKDLLISKMISHMIGISVKKILKGRLNFEESSLFLDAFIKIINNKNLLIIDASEANFELIEQSINTLKENYINDFGIEDDILVILDYLNIFKHLPQKEKDVSGDANNKISIQMTEFIRMKNDTKSNWIIILAKNKQGYNKKGMGTIKGSNDLEYGFETLISLENPDEDFPISDYPENKETGFLEVNTIAALLKARWDDPKSVIPLYFNGAKNRFYEPTI